MLLVRLAQKAKSALVGSIALLAVAPVLAADNSRIVIGTVFNTEGFQAVLDVPSARGAALALDQINKKGGVLGRQLSAIAIEGRSDAEELKGKTEAQLRKTPEIVALMGLSDTDMVLAAARPAAKAGRVFLTSGATSPKLTQQIPDYLFLACFGDNVQAAAGAEWAYEDLAARRVHVLFDPHETYPLLLQGYFIDRFKAIGGTITSAVEIDSRAAEISVANPGDVDLVFLSVETAEDAVRVLTALRASGYDGPVLGGDGYDAPTVWASNTTVANVYFTTHAYLAADNPNPLVGDFLKAYSAAYPGEAPSSFAALGYDAMALISKALAEAGEATPDAVGRGLSGLNGFRGVTGTINFADGQHIPRKSVSILKVAHGDVRFVAEKLPQSVPAP